MAKTLLVVLLLALLVLLAVSSTRAGDDPFGSSKPEDSDPKKLKGFVAIAGGYQALKGNDYLETLLTRYTDAGILNGGARFYIAVGGIWHRWAIELHMGYYYRTSNTTYLSDGDGTFTISDFSMDVWARKQFVPLQTAQGLSLSPGIALGLTLPELRYEQEDAESENLLNGTGLAAALGLAIDYRISSLSFGFEYQYRFAKSSNIDKSEFVTLPEEPSLDLTGNSLYITCKLYWDSTKY